MPQQLSFMKRMGLSCQMGLYVCTVIDSFDADTIHLQFGGSLEFGDIAKIEEIKENDK